MERRVSTTILVLGAAAGLVAATCSPPAEGQPDASPAPCAAGNTLWLGNSLVRYQAAGPYAAYDVPEVIERMRESAVALGRAVPPAGRTRVLAQDGFGLEGWWRSWYGYTTPDGETVSAARAIVEDPSARRGYDARLGYEPLPAGARWNRIVALSLANYLDPDEHWYEGREVVPATERWYRFIREQDPRTEILHYVAPADSRKIGRRQPRVDALYRELAAEHGGRIVPVGAAFVAAMRAQPGVDLRRSTQNDYLHYNDRGVLLTAATFYAVLYGDPVGLPVPAGLEVGDADAGRLLRTARDAVNEAGSAAPADACHGGGRR